MKTLLTIGRVDDGHLSIPVPEDVATGAHRVVVIFDEQPLAPNAEDSDPMPVLELGSWPENLSLSRSDLYDDDRR